MFDFGGIIGMPAAPGTPGSTGGVSAGDAPAPDAPNGSAFTTFFDAVVAVAEGSAPGEAPAAETAGSGAGIAQHALAFLVGQDVQQAPGAATAPPGVRARMFRTDAAFELDRTAELGSGEANDVTAEIVATVSPVAVPPAVLDAVPAPQTAAGANDARQAELAAAGAEPDVASRASALVQEAPATSRSAAEAAFAASGETLPASRSAETGWTTTTRHGADHSLAADVPATLSTHMRATVTSTANEPVESVDASRGEAAPAVSVPAQTRTPAAAEVHSAVSSAGSSIPQEHADVQRGGGAEAPAPSSDVPSRPQHATGMTATRPHETLPLAAPPRPERMDARAPEASTEAGVAIEGARQEFGAEDAMEDSQEGSRRDAPGMRQAPMTGQTLTAASGSAQASVPASAAEPPAPTRLTPEQGEQVTSQIVQSMRTQLRGGIGEAVIRLKPEYLGEVTITVRVERGQVEASVKAELPAVREWLEAQEPAVRQSLGEQGLSLSRLRVEPDGQREPSDDGRQEQAPSNGRQPRQQRQSEEGFELLV